MWTGSSDSLWSALQGLMHLDKTMGKWFLAILVVVFITERASFSILKKTIHPITNKVLANRLKELETVGLLAKDVVLQHPKRVEYYLTEKGKAVAKGFAALAGLDKLSVKSSSQ